MEKGKTKYQMCNCSEMYINPFLSGLRYGYPYPSGTSPDPDLFRRIGHYGRKYRNIRKKGESIFIRRNAIPRIEREFYEFYRNPERGEFTPKGASPGRTTKPTVTSNVKFMNCYPLEDIETISPHPMLFITGDQAHSKEFSVDAYRRAAEPKELYYVKGAGHVDLYDRLEMIPFDKLDAFFNQYLK